MAPGPPTFNDARHHVSIAPNTAPVVANFRPSRSYNHAVAGTQSDEPSPTFSAPPAPMAGAIPANTNGLVYGGLPGPQSSQLPPITLPPNQIVVPPDGHTAVFPGQQGRPVPSTPETTHQSHQSSDVSPQDKRHKSSGRGIRSAEEIVAVFTKWLDEYDRRSQERYDAAKKMYNELHNDHTALKTEIKTDCADLIEKLPHLERVSEQLGECVAGNRYHHDRITRLENRLTIGDYEYGQMSSRFAACETGLAQMGQRMRQFEDDRMAFVSKETLDALEIAHTQGAESRLRLVAESIRADLTKRTAGLDRISEEVRSLIDRTSRIEESGFQKATDTSLSNIEEDMRELQEYHRDPTISSAAFSKIAKLESQIIALKNELEDTKKPALHLDDVSKEMEQLKKTIRQLKKQQGKHAEFITNFPIMEAQAKERQLDSICDEIKQYDPSRSPNDGLEQLISAVFSNPALSARLQSNGNRQQHSQSHAMTNGDSSQLAGVATAGGEPDQSSTSSKETDQAKDGARNHAEGRVAHEGLNRLRTYLTAPENAGVRKELVKMRRPVAARDSGSDDEIAVKRLKTKSNSRAQ